MRREANPQCAVAWRCKRRGSDRTRRPCVYERSYEAERMPDWPGSRLKAAMGIVKAGGVPHSARTERDGLSSEEPQVQTSSKHSSHSKTLPERGGAGRGSWQEVNPPLRSKQTRPRALARRLMLPMGSAPTLAPHRTATAVNGTGAGDRGASARLISERGQATDVAAVGPTARAGTAQMAQASRPKGPPADEVRRSLISLAHPSIARLANIDDRRS